MPKHYSMGGPRARCPAAGRPRRARCRGRCASASGRCATCRRSCGSSGRPIRALTLAQCALRLLRALLPVVTLYVGKLIIDEVVALTQTAGAPPSVRRVAAPGSPRPDPVVARAGIRARRALRRAWADRVVFRFAARRADLERDEPAGDGARGNARSGGLRGQRIAGPAGARAQAGGGTHDVDRAVTRAGAGRRDDRHLRRRASSSTRRGSSCSSP